MAISAVAARLPRIQMKITSEKVIVVLGRAIDAVGSLVFLKMLASLAAKNDVGTYLLAASYLAIMLTISFSAFDQGLLRNVADYRKRASLAARYSAMLLAYLGLAAVLAGLSATVMLAFNLGAALHVVLVPLAFWFVFESLKNLNMTVASGLRSRHLIAGASAVDYSLRIGLLWAVHTWGAMSSAAILGLLGAAGMAASIAFLYGQRALLSHFRWGDVTSTLADSIRFSWPMIIWGLFGWLQNMSNRWMLSHFANLAVVAEYGVLVAIGTFPVTALLGLVVTYVVPILYEREGQAPGSSRTIVHRVALGLTPLCGLMVLVTGIWHREITTLLSGPSYTAHSDVLPFVMAAACANAICSVLTYTVYAQRRVAALLFANTLPGLFSLIFGYFVIKQYQFDGAILILISGNIISAILFVFAFRREK